MSYTPSKTAEYLFSESNAALANGAALTTPWLDMAAADKYQFEAKGASGGFTQLIESSSNPAGAGATVVSSSTETVAFRLFNVTARQRYMRFTWTNISGAPVDAYLAIKATYGSSDKLSVTPLSNQPVAFSQAALVRAVTTGEQPDGDYVNQRTDGTAFSTSTPLGVSGVYTSPWVDSDGWNSIKLFVATNQVSDEDGIRVQFTDDVQGAATVRAAKTFWFDTNDIARGYVALNIPPLLDGFRVIYTNGAVAQTAFFMQAELKTNSENSQFNPAGALQTSDFLTEVALGTVPNYLVGNMSGRNPDVDAGNEDIWNGGDLYTGQPIGFTPEIMRVNSSSAADTAAGTGARTVMITGLRTSASNVYTTETVVLNGTALVSTVNTWWRVNRARVLTAGSGRENAGTIEVKPITTTTAVMARVPVGYNRSTIAAYTVPAQRIALVKRVRVGIARTNGSAGSATISLRARPPGGVFEAIRVFEVQTGTGTNFELLGGIVLQPGTDLKYRVDNVSDPNTVCEGALEYVLQA